jgi:GT2 family glycosyltransferase
MNFTVIIPTYNPGEAWSESVSALDAQIVKPAEVLIVDSASRDGSVSVSVYAGYRVETIDQLQFNHGGTRNMAVDLCSDCEFVVFLTQDAVLADSHALEKILAPFSDSNVTAVCGRQLPRKLAAPIETHARLFNYSEESVVRSINDKDKFGLKTAFLSNSFAAYRVSALKEVGGFPEKVIFGEDMYVAAKMLKIGYKIAYAADACVYHSHQYSVLQEMKRYFDMGVFHSSEPWIRRELGGAEGQGVKFVVSEFKYLLKHAFWRIPEGLLRTMSRYTGFRVGLMGGVLPTWLNRKLAMNKGYFDG